MKTRFLVQTVYICSLFLSCAEAPEYTPRQPTTSTTSPNQSATKNPATSDAQKTAENKDTSTTTPEAPKATPTPTPTPSAAPVPNPTAGVPATGKTLVMQSCAASCHLAGGMPGTPIDARNDTMLADARMNPSHANLPIFFTRPAAGAPATSFTHVAAYLMKVGAGEIVRGPTLPEPQP